MRKLVALSLVAASGFLFADGHSDKATVDTKAWIVAPVKITGDGPLNFGKIVVDDVNVAASVVMKPKTTNNGPTVVDSMTYTNCAKWKHSEAPEAAQFHISQDIQDAIKANVNVKFTATPLTGGVGGDCTLSINPALHTDLPADECGLGSIKGQKEIDKYVKFKHFGVGGQLDIPAGALGEKKGTLTVEAYYL